MKIAVNGGHGPNTPGKRTPDGIKEFEFNYPTAKYLQQYLEEYDGVQVLFIPDPNRDVPLKERTDKANRWGADLWLSIHYNAHIDGQWTSANGIETWVYKTRPKTAVALAEKVQSALVKATGRTNRGVKAGDLHELRETKCTAILCECGFMTNKQEAATMKDPAFQKLIARTIADTVASFYGLKKKGTSKPSSSTNSGTKKQDGLYKVQIGAFRDKKNAEVLASKAKRAGFDVYIVEEG